MTDTGDVRHDEVEELLGAYALDAVDADERATVEAHLATCPRCRAEVDAHREVAAHLGQGGAPAPEHLWERIADALGGEAPPPIRLVVDRPIDPAAPRVRPRRQWWPRVLAVAATVAIVALSAGLVVVQGRVDDLEDDDAVTAAAASVFAAPDARTADLAGDDGTVLARAAVLPDGTGYVLADGLPELDDGTYQLWGTDGTTVVSLGVLGPAPEVVGFHADPDHDVLMVTEEDRPVERTEQQPVLVGQLA